MLSLYFMLYVSTLVCFSYTIKQLTRKLRDAEKDIDKTIQCKVERNSSILYYIYIYYISYTLWYLVASRIWKWTCEFDHILNIFSSFSVYKGPGVGKKHHPPPRWYLFFTQKLTLTLWSDTENFDMDLEVTNGIDIQYHC